MKVKRKRCASFDSTDTKDKHRDNSRMAETMYIGKQMTFTYRYKYNRL